MAYTGREYRLSPHCGGGRGLRWSLRAGTDPQRRHRLLSLLERKEATMAGTKEVVVLGRITIDPDLCNGKPTIRGKWITADGSGAARRRREP